MKYFLCILLLVSCDDRRKATPPQGNKIIDIPLLITDPPPPYTPPREHKEGPGRGGRSAPVPEPGTLFIFGTGIASLVAARRRSRNNVR